MGQHDTSFNILFSHPFLVESLIRGFLPDATDLDPEWVEELDFSALEPVSEAHGTEDWGMRYNDRVWRLRWGPDGQWIYVYVMIEFQRTDPPFMAARVLSYEGVLYQHIIKSLRLKRGDCLPVIIPFVLHNGDGPWRSATELSALLPEVPRQLRPFLPNLRFILIDIRHLNARKLEKLQNAVACLFRLEQSPGPDEYRAAVTDLAEILVGPEHAELRDEFVRWIHEVHLPSRLSGVTVSRVETLEEVAPMLAENTMDWSLQWREQGRLEGRKQGRLEGRKQGEAALLLRLMTRKLGPLDAATRARVESADDEQLLVWGDRLLEAASLAEVFGGKG